MALKTISKEEFKKSFELKWYIKTQAHFKGNKFKI